MRPDDIISYLDVVHAEKAALQKGMNYDIGKGYSVFLMSVRRGAPYADATCPEPRHRMSGLMRRPAR